ncbi:MAG: crotonase/enoyl-CoA hydratase family protein [Ectothiorhodospiraceae bacterium]|nr:crotonase/enoyl-CoA hydratase family protein [Ectothiorhodospiraceae bacterium]
MSYTCFDVTIESQIAHVVMNRPDKRNSMIREFWEELPRLIRDIDENVRARVIVISSTGPHFTGGLDVSAFADMMPPRGDDEAARIARRQAGLKFYDNVKRMQDTFTCLERCRVPVLVAIQGGCIGGGVDMVTACDMRYATEDAFLTIQEINIGMTADVGTFPRIFKLMPEGIARELAYTGRRMSSREALQLGLVNRVYPDQAAMLADVMGIAREIAQRPPLAVHGCKRMANYARDHSTEDALDYIGIWNASMLQPEEVLEAMEANREKRPGKFAELPPIRPPMSFD